MTTPPDNENLLRAHAACKKMRTALRQEVRARRERDEAIRRLVIDDGFSRSQVASLLGISTSLVKYVLKLGQNKP